MKVNSRIKVGEVISVKVYACAPTNDIKEAFKTMRKKKAPGLPVVDGAGALKGILSIDDILRGRLKARRARSSATKTSPVRFRRFANLAN